MKFGLLVSNPDGTSGERVPGLIQCAERVGVHQVWAVDADVVAGHGLRDADAVLAGASTGSSVRVGLGATAAPSLADRVATLSKAAAGRVDVASPSLGAATVDAATALDASRPGLWLICADVATMLTAARQGFGALTFGFTSPANVVDHVRAYERVMATECVPLSPVVNTSFAVVVPVTAIDAQLVDDLRRFELAGVDQVVVVLPAGATDEQATGLLETLGRTVIPEFAARDAVRSNGKRLRLSPLVEIALSKRPA